MSVVDGESLMPTPKEGKVLLGKLAVKITLALAVLAVTISFVVISVTNHDQAKRIAQIDSASECRAQKAINEAAASDDVLVSLLDSIVRLGNQQPLDFEKIAAVSAELKQTQADRRNSVSDCK
jgi:hypothetical protein